MRQKERVWERECVRNVRGEWQSDDSFPERACFILIESWRWIQNVNTCVFKKRLTIMPCEYYKKRTTIVFRMYFSSIYVKNKIFCYKQTPNQKIATLSCVFIFFFVENQLLFIHLFVFGSIPILQYYLQCINDFLKSNRKPFY